MEAETRQRWDVAQPRVEAEHSKRIKAQRSIGLPVSDDELVPPNIAKSQFLATCNNFLNPDPEVQARNLITVNAVLKSPVPLFDDNGETIQQGQEFLKKNVCATEIAAIQNAMERAELLVIAYRGLDDLIRNPETIAPVEDLFTMELDEAPQEEMIPQPTTELPKSFGPPVND